MKIRRKLLITYLALCLIPLIFGTIYATYIANQSLTEKITDHLESVASIQKTKIQSALNKHLDRLALVTSRTQLRISLDEYNRTRKISDKNRIAKIINDAKAAIADFKNIAIVDLQDNLLIATGSIDANKRHIYAECLKKGKESIGVGFLGQDSLGTLETHLYGPIKLNDELIGVIVVDTKMPEVGAIAQDYTGLNETGETVVAMHSLEGDALFISPLRFDKDAAFSRSASRNNLKLPMTQALLKHEILLTSAIDYRGEEVVAATRYIADADWGLVVKMDKAEAFAPIRHLRNSVFLIIFLAAILILIISYYLSRSITSPLNLLDKAAAKLSNGDWASRAEIRSKDEIGSLAQAFNIMAENLTTANTELEQNVAERTVELDREIQEQIKTEEALRALTERNETLLAAVPDIIMEVDSDRIYTFANAAGYDFFGEVVIGKEASFYFEGEQQTYDIVQPLFNGMGTDLIYVESWQRRRDGQVRLLAWWCRSLKDANGNIIGTLSSARDITDQNKAEKALCESQSFKESLLKASPDIIYIYDLIDQKNVYSNQGIMTVLGYSVEEIKAMGENILSDLMHPDDFDIYLNKTIPRYPLAKDGQLIEHEYRMMHRDGTWRWLFCKESIFMRLEDGAPKQIFGMVGDITERKQAEEALKQSEERWQFALEGSRGGVWDWNVLTNEVFFSKRWKEMLGYEEHEIANDFNEWDKLLHPEEKEKSHLKLNKHLNGETDFLNLEHRLLCKDGTYKWILAQGKVIERTADDKPLRVIGTHNDISERKRAENELKQIHGRLTDTLESMTDGFVSLDKNWIYTYVNKKAAEMFGRKPEDLVGKHIWTEFPEGINQPFYKNYYKAVKTKKIIIFEDYYPPWDRWYENRIIPTENDLAIFFQDITESKKAELALQEAEKNFRDVVENLPDGILIAGAEGRIIFTNKRFEEISGYSKKELLTITGWDMTRPEDIPKLKERMQKRLEGKRHAREYERVLVCKDGSEVTTDFRTTTTFWQGEKRPLAIIHDLTDRKEAEQSIHLRSEELDALNVLGRQVSRSLSLDEVISAAVKEMARMVQSDAAFIFLRKGEELHLAGISPKVAVEMFDGVPVHRVGECMCGLAVSEGKSFYAIDIYGDTRCTWDECKKAGFPSFASLPLRSGAEIIGVVGLACKEERDFEAQAEFLETLASQVAGGIRNAQLYEEVRVIPKN